MRLSLSVITLKTIIILKLYDLSLSHRQDMNGSKIREYIHQVVSFLSQFVATYTPSMFTRSLYNIWTRDLRRETNQSQWTATVKRSRYICFFHLALHIGMYMYTYIRWLAIAAIFSRMTVSPLGIELYRLRYCYVATRKAVDIILIYDGSCAMLTFHFWSYDWHRMLHPYFSNSIFIPDTAYRSLLSS